jgi:hypothetical protein
MSMNLTKDEQKLIIKRREEQKREEENNKPKMQAVLKHDLFYNDINNYDACEFYISKKDIKKITDEFFEKILSAVEIFDCYYKNGKESWYDREYGVENMDREWAREHLKNIRKV